MLTLAPASCSRNMYTAYHGARGRRWVAATVLRVEIDWNYYNLLPKLFHGSCKPLIDSRGPKLLYQVDSNSAIISR